MKIEKSICGKFVRVTIGQASQVFTLSDFSKSIGRPAEFVATPGEKMQVEAR